MKLKYGEYGRDELREMYKRLRDLEAMDLPPTDPRMMAGGELPQLRFLIRKALGIKPWDRNPSDKWAELAAGFDDEH